MSIFSCIYLFTVLHHVPLQNRNREMNLSHPGWLVGCCRPRRHHPRFQWQTPRQRQRL